VVISDTVGFVRELPHQLVAAFRATLEETIHADLLLHVVDASSPVRMEQIEQVNLVLQEIGADHIPQILVWNKIDAAGLEPSVERGEDGTISRVFVSAQKGSGLDLLREAIVEMAKNAPRSAHLYQNDEAQDSQLVDEQDDQQDLHDGAALDLPQEAGQDDGISTHSKVGTR
jgi:GTP-binding protein HflX